MTTVPAQGDKAESADAEMRAITESCQEFEAIFVREFLKVMRSTVPGEQSRQKEMYIGLFDEQISRVLAQRGMGLANIIVSRLKRPDFSPEAEDLAKVFGKTDDNLAKKGL